MESVKTRTRTLTMLNSNTVKIVYNDNVTIDLEDALEDYKQYDLFTMRKKMKKLVLSGRHTSMSTEAREYINRENVRRKEEILAEAIVINSLAQRLLTKFYYNIVSAKYPIEIFNSSELAEKWLFEQKLTKKITLFFNNVI